MNILDEITAYARVRVAEDKKSIVPSEMRAQAEKIASGEEMESFRYGRFARALQKEGMRFICEVKKASPSKGLISPDFPYLSIARDYESAGADCISCLSEPKWFLGSDAIFREIRASVDTPMIRKDFTVDPYQLYQAKVMGADCVLLICAVLDTEQVRDMLQICDALHLDALVETHNEEEIDSAIRAGSRIIGVNNRNLKDFTVDFSNAAQLRDKIPSDCIYVAESGVKGPEDVHTLKQIGADAVLIGETLMRSENKSAMLQSLRNA